MVKNNVRQQNDYQDDGQELKQQEEQEADRAHASRRRIDDFLMRARADQNERDRREREELERQQREHAAWDDTLEAISRNLGYEFDR